ncbi:bifunctional [glutamine synthetase] adenylyltransferase/[glutamine synthetase]-adenylyl-L-tyrosine phosphorylase [Marihabitans asiaticum]|uniref:Bifunctional glutamine synthetase adenylyltransferase/adenylyl-removing enzyme n=1 Tax=Marihabitans asiaticum TaxID=415218 RepID=A0A560WAH2_9MICO|nr:bifunctional [glutamine synthetase] adenylyltransferase/[glutamine synthetase]-adenylyl-L-tyrosine phosphorylase [Marihabitans asiaticum]TWD14628.1 glutamate-ammonia-ligase adenylyltransferase [Marihabitans asiaticum]
MPDDTGGRTPSADLSRHGILDTRRGHQLIEDPALDPLTGLRGEVLDALATTADPDAALLGLVRLLEVAKGESATGLVEALRTDPAARDRVLGVLGASSALTDHLVAHPEHWRDVAAAEELAPQERVEAMLAAVREPDGLDPQDALRVEYRRQLCGITARDVSAPDPAEHLPSTASALADLAGAALEAAVDIASREAPEDAHRCRLAVIGMGKSGGRELNYLSDVDVIFVAEARDGCDEDEALAAATRIATRMMAVCSASTSHGSLWPVDAALRPEGKQGPLVRTVASHKTYYERWAKTWEFQALLKARPVAGDADLGQAYLEAIRPFVWEASSREDFVDDVQAMRRRVEDHIPSGEAARQIKLGPGGLRDVEFSVQLLQLVHGRADPSVRSGTTLVALDALARGGYIGREDAATLDHAYRVLRALEHRIQLRRLRRTHLMPTAEAELRVLGRAMKIFADPADSVTSLRKEQSVEVRRLHERLFYRPLLSAVAKLSTDEVRLSPEAAKDRLLALGYRDPDGALRHLQALTDGVSRTASIQKQLLPVMLGWFADEADPDAGLLAFRKVSESLGTTHWYLRLLRDEGEAAHTLATVLGASRFAADLLLASPEAVQMLGESTGLEPRSRQDVLGRMRAAAGRKDDLEAAIGSIRSIRRAEYFRIAVADLTEQISLDEVGVALTDLTSATIDAALEVVVADVEGSLGRELGTDLLVVGMGRLGGAESGYSSDADVLFVHDPHDGVGDQEAQEGALEVVRRLQKALGTPGSDPPLGLDADLRPEGRSGPIIRSLASYRAYYERWSEPWEAQALLRAAPVAGDADLGERFTALIDPLRWPEGGLSVDAMRQVRRLKARMEGERLPRGADRRAHFKLGYGGLSDVEWTVQLLQMQHAHSVPGLRTTRTLRALAAAEEADLVSTEDAAVLRRAWSLASRLRNAGMLARGRPVDSVPSNARESDGVARIVGLPPQSGSTLADSYRRATRHARAVVDRVFYGES